MLNAPLRLTPVQSNSLNVSPSMLSTSCHSEALRARFPSSCNDVLGSKEMVEPQGLPLNCISIVASELNVAVPATWIATRELRTTNVSPGAIDRPLMVPSDKMVSCFLAEPIEAPVAPRRSASLRLAPVNFAEERRL